MANPNSPVSTYINADGKLSSSISSFPLANALPNVMSNWERRTTPTRNHKHVANCETTFDLWKTLEMHFLIDSKARILHLRNLLQTTRKEKLSINDYARKIKEVAGSLTASGVVVNDEELLMYILDGLGTEYDAVVANLTSRSGDVSLQEAQFLLHKHEMR
ncbi:uncharacterized protein LOC116140586 [Pistacia vera]|uniref:uncharacterized protein LOC116140586 n=1 Tax=Pistacia vera TaxID=55513 RepID=UPI0012634A8B|nr:uncharacterized protein LOC116140586 [Pistacia vera]